MADSTSGPVDTEDGHRSKKARVDPDATINTVEHDDAETEDEEPQPEEDDQDDDDEVEEEEERESGNENENENVEDRLEEGVRREERDEALDGDDSD